MASTDVKIAPEAVDAGLRPMFSQMQYLFLFFYWLH